MSLSVEGIETLLAKGKSSLSEDKLSDSERFFSLVVRICQNKEPRDYVGSQPAFLGLVTVYMKYGTSESLPVYQRQEALIKAAVLCHYVMNLAEKCGYVERQDSANDSDKEAIACSNEMKSLLHCIESELLKSMNVICEDLPQRAAEHKMLLVRLRERVKEEILKVETITDFDQSTVETEKRFAREMTDINNTICDSVKDLVQKMITECQVALGKPPCEFVAVCLGSFAFGTTTPYSDLEWVIILDVEDEHFKEYFRNLSRLFQFKIVNLGETIVPSVMIQSLNSDRDSWFYDDVTPRGLAFDGAMVKACKTPLGRRDDSGNVVFELIHSPEKMAEFQNLEWLNKSFELACSLRSFQVVYSSEPIKGDEIILRYKQELRNQLERHVEGDSPLFEEEMPSDKDESCCLPKEMQWKKESEEFGFQKDNALCSDGVSSPRSHSWSEGNVVQGDDKGEENKVCLSDTLDIRVQGNDEVSSNEKIYESTDKTSSNDAQVKELGGDASLIIVPDEDAKKIDTVTFETRTTGISSKENQENKSQESSSQLRHDTSNNHEEIPDQEVQSDVGRLTTVRNQHVKKLMANDMPTYHLHDVLCTSDTEGMIYNVKKDLYRQPERALSILFLQFGIESSDVYGGLEELQRNGVVSGQVKMDLFVAMSIACELRLRAYLEHDRQMEELDIPSSIPGCCNDISSLAETEDAPSVKARLDRLVRFYRIVLPFLEKVREDQNESGADPRPMNWRFTDLGSSSYYNALIHLRLLRYEDARYFSLRAIHENPERANSWQLLARLLEQQGKYDKAYRCLVKSFHIFFAEKDEVISLCLETKQEGLQEAAANEELPTGAWVKRIQGVVSRSQQIKFLITCLQRMALDSFFASQYQRAWRFFRMVYHLVRSNPLVRKKYAVSSVFCSTALCLSTTGRYQEAIDILEFILENNLVSPIQIPKARDNLGNVYFRVGNYSRALEEYHKALNLRRNYYRVDGSPFFVISYVNIGNVLAKIGQVTESSKCYRQALEVNRRIYNNPCANYTELCYSGIGVNLLSIGRKEEALDYCKKSVEISRNRLGHCIHKSNAMALMGLGNCYLYLMRFDEAVKTYEASVDILQKIRMEEDADVLPVEISTVYCNLAVALHQQGQSDVALRWLQEAENKMVSCVSRDSHSNMGVVLHAKAQISRAQGKHNEAKELLENALDVFLNVFGTDVPHPLIIATLSHLGNLLISLRQYAAAVDRFRRALRLLNRSFPEDAHVQLKINANKNMGYALYQFNQIPDALVCYKRALEIRTKHAEASPLDVDPSLILSLYVEAGNAYIRAGNQREAMRLYEAALRMPVSLSRGVCDLKQVALSLAAMQTRAGLLDKAIESFQTAVSLHVKTGIDEIDPFVVKCYQNQAALYQTIGNRENACLYSEKALEVQLLVTNSKPHEGTAKLLAQVAEAWSYSDTQKAVEFGKKSLQMVAILGSLENLEHNVLSDLGFYYHLHGLQQDEQSEQRRLYKEAEENYNRALELKRNEATFFNLAFLLMTNSRFHEALALLKSVPERCGKESVLGFDDRDAPLLNRDLRKRLFSPHKNNEVVFKTVVLAYLSMVQCYKALEDYTNALSEAFKLERFVCELENPGSTDYVLVACAFEEMNKPTKAEFFFKKCSSAEI